MPAVTPGGYGRFYDTPASSTNDSSSYTGTRQTGPLPYSNDGPAKPGPDIKNGGGYGRFVDSPAGSAQSKLYPGVDFTNMRLQNAGLNKGGANSEKSRVIEPEIRSGITSTSLISTEDDWRIRVSLPTKSQIFYQDPNRSQLALKPIIDSGVNGVIFPYTPSINVQHNARYQPQNLTHSNYTSYFYEGSDVAAITISGEFSAQNEKEAAYVLACVHFLRACTKMFFGQSTSLPVGTPPTIVFLDGYGQFYFPHVSCVVTNFSHTLPADVDYIPLKNIYQNTRIPTLSTISITLQPVVSRKRIHEDFNLDYVAQGLLLGDKKGVGGFL
jgi:hypothetical protein